MRLEVLTELVKDEKSNRVVVNVKFPTNQKSMSVPETAMVLSGGLAALIRGASKENCGMTDYELMKTVIDYLNSEFASATSFNDVVIHKKIMKNEP